MNNKIKKEDTVDHGNRPSLNQSIIGSETWNCEGMPVTSEMRREILEYVGSLHQEHTRYDECDSDDQITKHATLKEFLNQTDPDPIWPNGKWTSYRDNLLDWLREYFFSQWGVSFDQMEEEHGDEWDGDYTAAFQVLDWLYPLRIEDVTAWYEQQK